MKTTTETLTELNIIKELAYAKYEEILQVSSEKLIHGLVNHEGHKGNELEYEIIIETLKNNTNHYFKVVMFTISKIIMSSVKETPRTVLLSQIASSMQGVEAHRAFRTAAVVLTLLEIVDVATKYKKSNIHGFQETITVCCYKLSNPTLEELKTKVYARPFSTPVVASTGVVGHFMKQSKSNEHMSHVLQKLNDVAYTLDSRVWDKFKYELAAYRFTDMKTQTAMVAQGDELVNETFYFSHKFGADNGRIYCEGDLFTLHGGALNYVFKFADKRVLSARGLEVLREHVADLHAKSTLSFKEKVEMYSLTLDLIDAEKGLPVGTILHKDGKISGIQNIAVATRDYASASSTGLTADWTDGRDIMSSILGLTKAEIKAGLAPYLYGAGQSATLDPIAEEIQDSNTGHVVPSFKAWEAAFAKAFPKAYELRQFFSAILKSRVATDTIEFTSPSGYECVITALETKTTAIQTCLGKLEYTRKVVDKDAMGVKAIAAFAHMLDASVLHHVVVASEYDIHVVHDSFGAHPNDVDSVCQHYVEGMQNHLCMPVLQTYVQSLMGDNGVVQYNVSRIISNTLTPSQIVGGLY